MRNKQWGPPKGLPVPLFSWNIFEFSLVPQNHNLNFLCSLLPEITFVLLFPSVLDLCLLSPWNKWHYSPVSQNPWKGLNNSKTNATYETNNAEHRRTATYLGMTWPERCWLGRKTQTQNPNSNKPKMLLIASTSFFSRCTLVSKFFRKSFSSFNRNWSWAATASVCVELSPSAPGHTSKTTHTKMKTSMIYNHFMFWNIKTQNYNFTSRRNDRKLNFRHARAAKILIRLRIRAVWSESSLSALWIAKDAKFLLMRKLKIMIRPRRRLGWFESSLGGICQMVRFLMFWLIVFSSVAFLITNYLLLASLYQGLTLIKVFWI